MENNLILQYIPTLLQIMSENEDIITKIQELYTNEKNPQKIRKLIEKHFLPTEREKKENAEVPTPVALVDEMLDKMPKSFWKKTNKVFEPCCGKGNFVLGIFDKFYKGMKSKYEGKEDKLCKKIIRKCLYFGDLGPVNVFITQELLKCHCIMYSENAILYDDDFNSYTGSTLDLDVGIEWGVDGFDAVIGNPPYQSYNATGDNKLYLEFIKYSLEKLYDNKYLLFIVPTNIKNYITNQDKNRPYIKNFMEIKYLSLNTSNKYFSNISTYFSYFLLKKKIVKTCRTNTSFMRGKKIEYSTININEKDKLPLCLSNNDFNIINKVSNLIKDNWKTFDIKKALYSKKTSKKSTQRIRNTHIIKGDIKENYDTKYKYKIIDKINKGNPFPGIFYYNNYKMINYHKPKIIMCSGGYLMPSLDIHGIYNLSDNMLYLLIDNEKQYKGLTILINSLLIKYLNKITMTDNIHGRDIVIKSIKYFDLSKIESEEDIYKELKINDHDLKLINNTISNC